MAKPRVFTHSDTHAGAYHLVSRVVDRNFIFGEAEKEAFVRMMRAFAAFHQVQILTFCVMSNHFHLLVRVPQRPEGFDMPMEEVQSRWQAAVGQAWHKGVMRQFETYRDNGSEAAIEEWRQRMLGRMFSLTEFMKALKQRFTQWYNRRSDRKGTLWEGRYKSVIVEDEIAALRTMSTYIDLNPVRAGMVSDPGDYRWCGYAEAMAGKEDALDGIIAITRATPANIYGQALGAPAPVESAKQRRTRRLRALVSYRQMLGLAGRPRKTEDGRIVRKGLSEKTVQRLEKEQGVRREQLLRRVRHLTEGVILGSREFINDWFQRNRAWFGGASGEKRETGARKISKDWRNLYNLRELRDRYSGQTTSPSLKKRLISAAAASVLSEAWQTLIILFSPKSPRMVPLGAAAESVGPSRSRTRAMTSSPLRASATTALQARLDELGACSGPSCRD